MAGEVSETEAATYPRGFSRDIDWKWPLIPARKLLGLNYGRALKADTRNPGKVPVFGTNGQCGWHDASLAQAPGLILGRKGQGPLGVEWCDKDFWVIDTAYYASTLTPDVELKYLYHLVKFIGLNHLKDGTSNPTLQAMALFQSWFLDFDPVRQNMDRNQPSTRASGHPSPNGRRAGGEGRFALDPDTAALFPEHLEDSAPGPIPKGWKAGTVVEGFNLTMEQSPPGETYNEEGNVPPFYQGRTDFSFRFPTRRIYCSAPTRYAKPGDTLVSVRTTVGTSTLRMRNAASGVVSQPCATNPARPHSPITLWRTSIPTSPASRPREPSSGPSINIASRNFPS